MYQVLLLVFDKQNQQNFLHSHSQKGTQTTKKTNIINKTKNGISEWAK